MKFEASHTYAAPTVRISLALVFLWFGTQQLVSPGEWVGLLPYWAPVSLFDDAETLIMLNGWLEIVLGTMLLVGFATRFAAIILGVHLFCIAIAMGGATGVRDLGLALATLSIVLAGPDRLSLDTKMQKA